MRYVTPLVWIGAKDLGNRVYITRLDAADTGRPAEWR